MSALAIQDFPRTSKALRTASKPRVLCIDDDPGITEPLARGLERCGLKVTQASSGRTGFEAVRRHPPDAIVTDIRMADGDGETLVCQVRANPETKRTPIIVLSAVSDALLRHRMQLLGADLVLRKPAGLMAITRALSQFIEFDHDLPGVANVPSAPSRGNPGSGKRRYMRFDRSHIEFDSGHHLRTFRS